MSQQRISIFNWIIRHYGSLFAGKGWEEAGERLKGLQNIVNEVTDSPPKTNISIPITLDWHTYADHYRFSVPRLQKNYRHWSLQARGFGIATAISLLVASHRLLLGDFGGMFASLACVLICFGLSIIPAWRCYQIQHHHLIPIVEFVHQPRHWWPPSRLPADYRLYAKSDYPNLAKKI